MRYVRGIRLEEVVPPDMIIDLVKIDVEGGDHSPLPSYSLTLSRTHTHIRTYAHLLTSKNSSTHIYTPPQSKGHEPQVFRGAERLFREHRIRRAIVEILPMMWDVGRTNESETQPRNITKEKVALDRQFEIIVRIMSYGYSFACANMDWGEIPRHMVLYSSQIDAQGQTTMPPVMREMMLLKKCVDWDITLALATTP